MGIFFLFSLLFLGATGQIWEFENVTVTTQYGDVIGRVVPVDDTTVHAFHAVPFAKAERFEKPEDPDHWGEFVAHELGDACPQTGRLIWLTHPGWNRYDEDCLHVDIYTPGTAGEYPVMLWFHGGGYNSGANIQYSGHFLASHDVVVVVANYRVNMLGFMSTDHPDYLGNVGMHDQVKAMEFVQENIRDFYGNPDRVTIFGQSAGASSTGLHVVSPKSQGLFHQAIYESGNDLTFWAVNWPAMQPNEMTKQVAEYHDCPTDDGAEMMECLKLVPVNNLINTSHSCEPGHFCMGFSPVIDGEFLPTYPDEIRRDGNQHKGPMMSGHCSEDGSPYMVAQIPGSIDEGLNRTAFQYHLRNSLLGIWEASIDEETFEKAYQATDWFYSPWPHIHDEELNRDVFTIVTTDAAFGYTDDMVCRDSSQYQPDTYHFIMGFRGSNATQYVPEWMGVPHNGELPYVWGYPLLKRNPAVRADSRMFIDIIDWVEDEDVPYADYVIPFWANFAKTGNPNMPETPPPPFENEHLEWPAYDMETYKTMFFGTDVYVADEYRQHSYAFLRDYMPWMTDRDFWFLPKSGNTRGPPGNPQLQTSYIEDAVDKMISEFTEEELEAMTVLYN